MLWTMDYTLLYSMWYATCTGTCVYSFMVYEIILVAMEALAIFITQILDIYMYMA